MLHYLIIMFVAFSALSGCSADKKPAIKANRIVFVSILPQKYFLDRICGDLVKSRVLVRPGESPASYEPLPSQMTELAESGILFSIGVPFEKRLLAKLQSQDRSLKVYDSAKGIERVGIDHDYHGHDHGDSGDPHIWLDPVLAKAISANMLSALIEILPEHKEKMQRNYDSLQQSLDSVHTAIELELEHCSGRELFVYHPSLGYFCRRYGLEQVAVEISGKEPSAKQLAEIGEKISRSGSGCMLIQPQFSSSTVDFISRNYGIRPLTVDPLSENYIENLYTLAGNVADCLGCRENE